MTLWNKDFVLVIIGQIVSLFGNAILRFAMPLYILHQSGSPSLFGLVSALSFLPAVILSPVGGLIADRVNKQRIMVVLDFSTSVLILAYIIISGYTSAVSVVVVVLMALYAIQGAYNPAVQASIPLLVGTEHLMPANAAVNLVTSLSQMLGPIIGGILYGAFGLSPVLILSCVCFFFSAVMELFIKIPHRRIKTQGGVWATSFADLRDSFRFIFKEKPILSRVIITLFAFNVSLSTFAYIGLPVIITEILKMSSAMYGITQGAMAAGGLIGGLLAGVLGKRLSVQRVHRLLLFCALSCLPISIVQLLQAPVLISYWIITASSFFALAAVILAQVQLMSFIQAVTPAEIVGKVIACLVALSMCAQPIGQLLYGQLFEQFKSASWAIALGAVVASCVVSMYSRRCFSKII